MLLSLECADLSSFKTASLLLFIFNRMEILDRFSNEFDPYHRMDYMVYYMVHHMIWAIFLRYRFSDLIAISSSHRYAMTFQMTIVSMIHNKNEENPSQNCHPCQKFVKSKNLIHFDDNYKCNGRHFDH